MSPDEITNITPMGFAFLAAMSLLIIGLPRRLAFVPLLISVCYITLGQRVVVFGLNFTAIRLIILAGWIRVLFRGEYRGFRATLLDKLVVFWVAVSFTAYVLNRMNTEALVNQFGLAYNVIGAYGLFRCVVRDLSEIRLAIKVLIVVAQPLMWAMLVELITRFNIFGIFGGVDFQSMVREGRVRCQGPFRHPILAGTFGTAMVPMALSIWSDRFHGRLLSVLGVSGGTAIMLLSGSSGPLLSYFAGIGAMILWRYHRHTRLFVWGGLGSIFLLHLVMNAPVWHLMAKISKVVGGTGWHRAFLIDQAIRYFGEWWLLGTTRTSHWSAGGALTILPNYPDMVDITSYYVSAGINGGVLSLCLLFLIIGTGFRAVGHSVNVSRLMSAADGILVWSLGATLLVHTFSFLSVSYFDQLGVIWYMLLSFIATVAAPAVMKPPNENGSHVTPIIARSTPTV